MTVRDVTKVILRTAGLGLLYLLASPVYAFLGFRRFLKARRSLALVRAGFIDCPHCGLRNPLDVLSTCRRCGVTEFGSRLFCSNCRQITRWFDCARCRATIRVL